MHAHATALNGVDRVVGGSRQLAKVKRWAGCVVRDYVTANTRDAMPCHIVRKHWMHLSITANEPQQAAVACSRMPIESWVSASILRSCKTTVEAYDRCSKEGFGGEELRKPRLGKENSACHACLVVSGWDLCEVFAPSRLRRIQSDAHSPKTVYLYVLADRATPHCHDELRQYTRHRLGQARRRCNTPTYLWCSGGQTPARARVPLAVAAAVDLGSTGNIVDSS